MGAILSIQELQPRKNTFSGLTRWHIVGVVLGIVSALASYGVIIFGIWIFGNLHGPVGFYPMAAALLYNVTLPLWKKRRGNNQIPSGKFFKILQGIGWGAGVTTLTLHILLINLGLEFPGVIARAFIP